MSQEGSVAPKERVNIVYKPATGDAQEQVELPLKLMVMGDFTQREDDRAVEDRELVSVDKDNFDSVLKGQNLQYKGTVANKLSDEPDAEMSVDLKFNSMHDFDPDAIVKQVPELNRMMELREALKALKGQLSNVPEFRKKVQELVADEGTRDKLFKELGLDK